MFKCHEEQVSVLGVCIGRPMMYGRVAGLNFVTISSARRAIDTLRTVSFDVVLVAMKLPDISTWEFLRQMRTAFPYQRWALVGGPITKQQETTVRMFGASTIFESTPTSHELLNMAVRLRDRARANILNGKDAHYIEVPDSAQERAI